MIARKDEPGRGRPVPQARGPGPAPGGVRAADAAGGMGFPHVPRLELDQLLVQLVDRIDQITLAQAEDHDRIAGDLHDHVIQELFALGIRLEGDAARSDPVTAKRIIGYIDTLDEVIKKIRASIFGLQQPFRAPAGLPARIIEIIEEHAPQLGFTADVSFAGLLDPGPGETLAHDILAVTREALSNCARHAHATAVSVSLALKDELITLDITDNGRGLGTPARSSGLSSMRRRAERNGGTFRLSAPAGGGTHLSWTARHTDREPVVPGTKGVA